MRQAAAKNKERIKQSTLIKKGGSAPNATIDTSNDENNNENMNSSSISQNNVNKVHANAKESGKEPKRLSGSGRNQGEEAIIRNPRPPTSSKSRPKSMHGNNVSKRTNNKNQDKKSTLSKRYSKQGKEQQQSKQRVGQISGHNTSVEGNHEEEEENLQMFLSQELGNESNNANDGSSDEEQEARRQVEYGALDGAIQAALNAAPKNDNDDFDDDAFHDGADLTRFVLDGKTLELPHFNAGNPLMHRIESLRVFLQYNMGEEALMMCYRAMNNISADDDSAMRKITQTLPKQC